MLSIADSVGRLARPQVREPMLDHVWWRWHSCANEVHAAGVMHVIEAGSGPGVWHPPTCTTHCTSEHTTKQWMTAVVCVLASLVHSNT